MMLVLIWFIGWLVSIVIGIVAMGFMADREAVLTNMSVIELTLLIIVTSLWPVMILGCIIFTFAWSVMKLVQHIRLASGR